MTPCLSSRGLLCIHIATTTSPLVSTEGLFCMLLLWFLVSYFTIHSTVTCLCHCDLLLLEGKFPNVIRMCLYRLVIDPLTLGGGTESWDWWLESRGSWYLSSRRLPLPVDSLDCKWLVNGYMSHSKVTWDYPRGISSTIIKCLIL